MFEFGSLIRCTALGFVPEVSRLGFISDKPSPADLRHGDAGQGHGCDRETLRSRLVPSSALRDHRRWRNGLEQYWPVPIELQIDFNRFAHDLFQLIGHL